MAEGSVAIVVDPAFGDRLRLAAASEPVWIAHTQPNREEAEKLGIETFRMMPALGDSPLFIAALRDLVLRAVGITADKSSERLSTTPR